MQHLKILAPVSSFSELKILCKSGASEFYCGYSPDSWNYKYNKLKYNKCLPIALNKRENLQSNISEVNELMQMVDFAKENKLTLFVALNNMSFPIQVYDFLYDYLKKLKDVGINGIIVSDIGFISFIKKEFPDFYIVLSCLNPPDNADSLNFFYDLGVNRITFPQHPSLKSIIEISKKQKKLDYECFILEGRCIYDQARCHSLHSIGFFCQDTWYYDYYGKKMKFHIKNLNN